MPQQDVPQPPSAPDLPKRVHFHRTQLIGVPLLALVPVLALFGVFGLTDVRVEAAAGNVEVSVEYPTVLRYKTIGEVVVEVRNASDAAIGSADVIVDREYLNGFSAVTFLPDVTSVTADRYLIALDDLPPATTRIVAIEVQAEHYWSQAGELRVSVGDTPVATFDLRTFVYP